MQLEEFERYLAASRGHSIMVDVRELPELPGLVRTVLVHRDERVTIEWTTAQDYAGGDIEDPFGPKCVGRYDSQDELIRSLEA